MEYTACIVELYSSNVSGFNAYKRELLNGLSKNTSIGVSRILLESPVDKFKVETNDGVTIYQIPDGLITLGRAISALLSMYIKDSPRTCFFLNFSPASSVAKALKEAFPKGRIIAVMHDFRWASHLMGDVAHLKSILDNGVQKHNDRLILHFYAEDLSLFDNSDCIISLSSDSYNIITSIYKIPRNKLRLIHNGLRDLSQVSRDLKMREKYNIPQGDHILLYSGRVSPQKGVMEILACFGEILQQHPNSWLVIAGSGGGEIPPEIRLRVILLGLVSQEEMFSWYRAADLGVFPSFYEQCSYTGIEMKMFGLPTIASDGIGVRCMFTEQNSIVARINTYSDLSSYRENLKNSILRFLALSSTDRDALGSVARKHYEETYTQDLMLDKYIDLMYEY